MVGMNKTGSNKPVVLLLAVNLVRIHDQLLLKTLIAIGYKTDNNGYTDNDIGDGHGGDGNIPWLFKVIQENNSSCKGRLLVILDLKFCQQLCFGYTAKIDQRLQRYF